MSWRYVSILILFCLGQALSAAAGEWIVPSQVQVKGETVSLGDILQSTGDKTISPHLAQTFLTKAPRPGSTMVLTGNFIRMKLAAAGLEGVEIPKEVRLARSGTVIDPALGEAEIRDYIEKNAPWSKTKYQISIVRAHDPMHVENGQVSAKISMPAEKILAGRHTYQVDYYIGEQRVGRGSFSVMISVPDTVYVAAHPLARGVIISRTDVVEKQIDLATVHGQACTNLEQLVGLRTQRLIQSGEVLLSNMLQTVPLIRRGDAVLAMAQREGLVVTAFAIAREDGAVGEIIKVQNVQSHAVIHGKVINNNTVQVLF